MTIAIFTSLTKGKTWNIFLCFVVFSSSNASQMSPKMTKFLKHFHFERSYPLSLMVTCIRKCNLAFEYIWRILIRGSSISLGYLTHLIKTETPKVNGLGDFDNISTYFHELTWESQKPLVNA